MINVKIQILTLHWMTSQPATWFPLTDCFVFLHLYRSGSCLTWQERWKLIRSSNSVWNPSNSFWHQSRQSDNHIHFTQWLSRCEIKGGVWTSLSRFFFSQTITSVTFRVSSRVQHNKNLWLQTWSNKLICFKHDELFKYKSGDIQQIQQILWNEINNNELIY